MQTADLKQIALLRNVSELVPIHREYYETWAIKAFDRKEYPCRNYLSPNRRDFYKILMITGGNGAFTLGMNTFQIDEPTMIFINPSDIISWKSTQDHTESRGYFVLFKRDFMDRHPTLKATIDRLGLFGDRSKSVISLDNAAVPNFNRLWESLIAEQSGGSEFSEESMQAYLQLLMIDSLRSANFPKPYLVTDEYGHIHKFFSLLEEETANINFENPIRMRTAKEFASSLDMHPNYLNRLLKQHTGQNVSAHIKTRILEETKILLLQTAWSLQEISYAIGFSDQPNFNFFFKKNTGITPAEFRKAYN